MIEDKLKAMAKSSGMDRVDVERIYESHFRYYLVEHNPKLALPLIKELIYDGAREYALEMTKRCLNAKPYKEIFN